MDRFSWKRAGEGYLSPEDHAAYIQEMQEQNKVDLVRTYLWSFQDDGLPLPDARDVMERFQDIELDTDMIQYHINELNEQ